MSSSTDKPFFQLTALSLIDDPAVPARESMDDDRMADLMKSISELTLLQPVGLKRNGERYEVVYGHRRTMACRRLELDLIPSLVLPADYKKLEAAKLHENIRREELNAGEEAVYFAQLLELIEPPDTDVLARDLNVSRDYVEKRLILLRGDEFVLAALKEKKITLAVAQELNRIKEDNARRDYLGYAIAQGASARVVINWRSMHEAMRDLNPEQIISRDEPTEHPTRPVTNPLACLLCSTDEDPRNMLYVNIHSHCLRIFEKQIGTKLAGFYADAPADVQPPSLEKPDA